MVYNMHYVYIHLDIINRSLCGECSVDKSIVRDLFFDTNIKCLVTEYYF